MTDNFNIPFNIPLEPYMLNPYPLSTFLNKYIIHDNDYLSKFNNNISIYEIKKYYFLNINIEIKLKNFIVNQIIGNDNNIINTTVHNLNLTYKKADENYINNIIKNHKFIEKNKYIFLLKKYFYKFIENYNDVNNINIGKYKNKHIEKTIDYFDKNFESSRANEIIFISSYINVSKKIKETTTKNEKIDILYKQIKKEILNLLIEHIYYIKNLDCKYINYSLAYVKEKIDKNKKYLEIKLNIFNNIYITSSKLKGHNKYTTDSEIYKNCLKYFKNNNKYYCKCKQKNCDCKLNSKYENKFRINNRAKFINLYYDNNQLNLKNYDIEKNLNDIDFKSVININPEYYYNLII